ncbi:MAG: endo alpha-1,4 polygalactosaminidase [Bacteroidales bacterium]|nr:endo alpha-1,4 polygalactosaminidase [Bacteroidales bacterium]
MKKTTFLMLLSILLLNFISCKRNEIPEGINFKQEMRNFVQGISSYAKNSNQNFIIIPQNGNELATENGDKNGSPATAYLNAIDGQGQEDLYYGYDSDDRATSENDKNYLKTFLDIEENNGVEVMVTDYCSTHSKMDDSYVKNSTNGYISFAAPERDLNVIPNYPATPYNVNSDDINTLSDAKNFLYLINTEKFSTKQDFINAISQTNYDLVLIDLFFNDNDALDQSDINALKTKQNGGKRLVICYMSIGEAEDYRYYWQSEWDKDKPEWLDKENPNWKGNYKVWYWEKEWQDIIFGNDNSYLKKILDAGFDGVYLDIIDAFEYYED